MAFPNSRPSMPPPEKKPALVIDIANDPKKPMGAEPDGDEGGKDTAKLAGAGVVREDEHCGNCSNWEQDGSCRELPGQFAEGDACLAYFEPRGAGEPDSDEADPESEGAMPRPGMEMEQA